LMMALGFGGHWLKNVKARYRQEKNDAKATGPHLLVPAKVRLFPFLVK